MVVLAGVCRICLPTILKALISPTTVVCLLLKYRMDLLTPLVVYVSCGKQSDCLVTYVPHECEDNNLTPSTQIELLLYLSTSLSPYSVITK